MAEMTDNSPMAITGYSVRYRANAAAPERIARFTGADASTIAWQLMRELDAAGAMAGFPHPMIDGE